MINLFGYPADLDGGRRSGAARVSPVEVFRHLVAALRQSLRRPTLRRLLAESMLQRGTWVTVKDYLQPVLQQAALALPLFAVLDPRGRSAVLIGAVYCGLYLLTALSARQAHRVVATAPVLGLAVDRLGLWPVGLAGWLAATAALALIAAGKRGRRGSGE